MHDDHNQPQSRCQNLQALNWPWYFTLEDQEANALPGPENLKVSWQTVSLPHDWAAQQLPNAELPHGCEQGFLDGRGVGWYRYHLCLPQPPAADLTYWLLFDGVYENSQVYINGKLQACHHYGYSPFQVQIGDCLQPGDNVIAVRVDRSSALADRWYSGAGIWRPVSLLIRPAGGLEREALDLHCNWQPRSDASLRLSTGQRFSPDCLWQLEVVDQSEQCVASGRAQAGQPISVPVACPRRWTATEPNLYTLRITLLHKDGDSARPLDQLTLRYGFTDFRFDSQQGFLVNGRPEKLKGVCLHQDMGCTGNAVTPSLLRQRLVLLKSLGCNAIRTSHQIPAASLLTLCDELGFYVLEEAFDKWASGSYGRFLNRIGMRT